MRGLKRVFVTLLLLLGGEDHLGGRMISKLLSVVPADAALSESRRLQEQQRLDKRLPATEPVDFLSLKTKADAIAAKRSSNYKPHQIATQFEFPDGTIRIKEAEFMYFRPMPPGGRYVSEQLTALITSPIKHSGGYYDGSISEHTNGSDEGPLPTAAPSNIMAPEKAIGFLNRGPMHSPTSGEIETNKKWWTLTVELRRPGVNYWFGNPHHFPTAALQLRLPRAGKGIYPDEPFFVKTAPRQWIWWTVVQYEIPLPNERQSVRTRYKGLYEYIYMDAITGRVLGQHCAEQPVPDKALVEVPCQGRK